MKRLIRGLLRVLGILLILFAAAALRGTAVRELPVDYDEDDYLRAGQIFAQGMRQGDWGVFLRENYRTEHPPLSKMVYGLSLLTVPPAPTVPDRLVTAEPDPNLPREQLTAARTASALFGWLEVAALTLINPLAGLFLGIHSYTIKYTSQVMLEGVPSLTSLLVVVFYLLYLRSGRKKYGWMVASAAALGMTGAAKYYYAVTGAAVLAHWVWTLRGENRIGEKNSTKTPGGWVRGLLGWTALAVLVFLLFDPYLWPDPVGRLWQSIAYHGGYAQSEQVKNAALPFYAPLSYLATSVPWHPDVIMVRLDILITFFALLGIQPARKRHPVFLLWLGLGLGFLLLWPTKWPQYILMITAPLSVVAADGFAARIGEPFSAWLGGLFRRGKPVERIRPVYDPAPKVLPWLVPGLMALAVITVFPLLFQLAMSMTDFSASAIRDGVNGGVWREVWKGITGQVKPANVNIFGSSSTGNRVHYTGLSAVLQILFGAGDYYVFEIVWTVLAILSQTVLGVALALLLNRKGVWARKFWQVLFILPWAVPEFVAALAWSQIFEPRFGFFTMAAKPWAQQAPDVVRAASSWQNNPDFALAVLLIAGLWYGFPFMLLSARAGLKLVPVDVYDAAALDGAGGWQFFWQITWPLIFPLLVPAIILRSIYTFNQFYLFTVLQTPVFTLSTLSYYVFGDGRYALSAAINIVTVLILIALVAWFNRWSKAGEGVTYA